MKKTINNKGNNIMTNQQLKNKVILSMKKDNDLKKYVNDIKKLNDDQFTVLINIFKKVNLNQ